MAKHFDRDELDRRVRASLARRAQRLQPGQVPQSMAERVREAVRRRNERRNGNGP